MGRGPQVGPFPSRPILGSIRGEGTPPTNPSRHLRKERSFLLSSACSRKAGEAVQPPSPPPTRRTPPLLAPATRIASLPPPPLRRCRRCPASARPSLALHPSTVIPSMFHSHLLLLELPSPFRPSSPISSPWINPSPRRSVPLLPVERQTSAPSPTPVPDHAIPLPFPTPSSRIARIHLLPDLPSLPIIPTERSLPPWQFPAIVHPPSSLMASETHLQQLRRHRQPEFSPIDARRRRNPAFGTRPRPRDDTDQLFSPILSLLGLLGLALVR